MQEFSFDISDALLNGLRPDNRRGLTAPFMDFMQNCKPSPFGIVGIESLDDVAALGAVNWPEPFAFKTHDTLFAILAGLFTITTTGAPAGWSATAVDVHEPLSESEPASSLANGGFASDTLWQKGTGWTISGGKATHAAGTGSDLTQLEADQTTALEDTVIYRVRFEVSDRTAGAVTPKCGTNAGTAASNNTTYVQYIKCTGGLDFTLTASSNFDGSIDNVVAVKIATNAGFAASGPWHVAQMGNSWFAVNDTWMLYKANVPGSGELNYFIDSQVIPQTVVNFDERIWFGGFNTGSAWISGSVFSRLRTAWQLKTETQATDLEFDPAVDGARMVMWGTRLGGDVFRPHILDLAALGLPDEFVADSLEAALFDAIDQGNLGFSFLPTSDVLRLLPLGQSLIAYGTDGITAIESVSSRTGYAVREVSEVGVAGRGAVVALSTNRHLFIDTQGFLWSHTTEGLTRLGFSEFLSSLTGSATVMVLDELHGDTYISDGSNAAHVMTREGRLGEVFSAPNSIVPWNTGYTVTRLVDVGNAGEDETIFKSPPFDMDTRGIKTIHGMEIDVLWEGESASIYGFIEYRYKNTEAWSASRDYLMNKEGVCFTTAAGLEFRACVRFDSEPLSGNHRVGRVTVRWKRSDRRFIRGISASGRGRQVV